jgi:Arc/MetJ-type ribon-helix-helix transcriptional regulator
LYVINSRKRCDMAKIQEKKLELLRRDIREGLESGDPTPWNLDEFLQEVRRRRMALKKEEPAT